MKNNDNNNVQQQREENKIGLYLIYDRVAGFYSRPFTAYNSGTAVRNFKQFCATQDPIYASDLDLFCVANYGECSGRIEALDTPEFIARGGSNE